MQFDFSALETSEIYKLMASTITPRPIAWITSQDTQGRLNAAPFSFFNAFSAEPPILGVGIGRRPEIAETTPKDSWSNIRATGCFVVQLVDEASAEAMNRTATPFAPGEDALILGQVVVMHVRDDVVQDPERLHIATERLGLIGRIHGSGWYARTTDLFRLERISLDEWHSGKR